MSDSRITQGMSFFAITHSSEPNSPHSACTALGGRISKLPNAFVLLVPAILDTGYLLQKEALDRVNFRGSHEWGLGVEGMFKYFRINRN